MNTQKKIKIKNMKALENVIVNLQQDESQKKKFFNGKVNESSRHLKLRRETIILLVDYSHLIFCTCKDACNVVFVVWFL